MTALIAPNSHDNDKNKIGAFMRFALSAAWVFFGSLLAAGAVYAQETGALDTGQKVRQRADPEIQKPLGVEAYERLLRDADVLVKSGKAADAYKLLEPLEFEHSGETRFDYLIGIAALDSGKPDKAMLAFERALAVDPDFAAARLDMARAYYQLGDLSRAMTEFELTLKQNPSAAAQLTIQKYLDAISEQEAAKQIRATGYVEGTIGHDNNVNNSTGHSQIFVDALGANRTLDPTNVKTSDNYYGVAAGGEVTQSLNERWKLYAGADLKQRGNSSQKSFDTFSLDARAGVMLHTGENRLSASVLGEQYNLGDSHNHDTVGSNAEWRHVLSPSDQLNVFGQYAQYRFVDVVMQVNDFNQQAMGIGWLHMLTDGKSTMFGSFYHGTEKDVSTIITVATPNGGRTDGAKRFSGLRIGGQAAVGDKTTLFVNAGGQVGEYSKVNPYFLRQRSDRQYDLTAGANWRWDKLLTLRPQLNYSKNNSNIAIYGYDRMDVSVTVRRDFR